MVPGAESNVNHKRRRKQRRRGDSSIFYHLSLSEKQRKTRVLVFVILFTSRATGQIQTPQDFRHSCEIV